MSNTNRINKKHFLILNNNGVISATTPKDWARANQTIFPKFTFIDSENTPRVEEIEKHLVTKFKYTKIENDEIVICYSYSTL